MKTTNEIHLARQKIADMIENPKYEYSWRTRLLHLQILGMLNNEYHAAVLKQEEQYEV